VYGEGHLDGDADLLIEAAGDHAANLAFVPQRVR